MIINVSTSNQGTRPIRLQFNDGSIYIALGDIIGASGVKNAMVLDDDNEKIISIAGKDNFTMLYILNIPAPMAYISQKGLKKLIDYPKIDEYLNKEDLSIIDEYITKNKKRILDILSSNEYKLKMNKDSQSNTKVVINDTSYNEKMKEINHHIKEAKKHIDIVIKLQEELIKGE